jgi:hypothetical protein
VYNTQNISKFNEVVVLDCYYFRNSKVDGNDNDNVSVCAYLKLCK